MGCLKAQCKRVTQFQALFRKCTNHPTNDLTPGLKFEKCPFSQPKNVSCWFILEKVAGIVITKFLLFFSFLLGGRVIFFLKLFSPGLCLPPGRCPPSQASHSLKRLILIEINKTIKNDQEINIIVSVSQD